MKKNPLVSVIVPNYNHAVYLKERIDSILNQTYQDFELILLDDCSTDNSRDILLSYKDNPHVTQIVFNETNSGSPFAQWNKGVELASGEWIWIAESDDWALPTFLHKCIDAIISHDNIGVVVSPVTYYDGNRYWNDNTLTEGKENTYYLGKQFIQTYLSVECLLPNVSAMLFNVRLLHQSRFDDCIRMKLCGDWLFYVHILAITDICVLKDSLSIFRRHTSITSMKQETLGMGMIEGCVVLRYMLDAHLQTDNYVQKWANKWWRNQCTYHYTNLINRDIRIALNKYNLKQIICRYNFYKIYKMIKRWVKSRL